MNLHSSNSWMWNRSPPTFIIEISIRSASSVFMYCVRCTKWHYAREPTIVYVMRISVSVEYCVLFIHQRKKTNIYVEPNKRKIHKNLNAFHWTSTSCIYGCACVFRLFSYYYSLHRTAANNMYKYVRRMYEWHELCACMESQHIHTTDTHLNWKRPFAWKLFGIHARYVQTFSISIFDAEFVD